MSHYLALNFFSRLIDAKILKNHDDCSCGYTIGELLKPLLGLPPTTHVYIKIDKTNIPGGRSVFHLIHMSKKNVDYFDGMFGQYQDAPPYDRCRQIESDVLRDIQAGIGCWHLTSRANKVSFLYDPDESLKKGIVPLTVMSLDNYKKHNLATKNMEDKFPQVSMKILNEETQKFQDGVVLTTYSEVYIVTKAFDKYLTFMNETIECLKKKMELNFKHPHRDKD